MYKMITDHVKTERDRIIASVIPEIECPDDCGICCEYHLMRIVDYEEDKIKEIIYEEVPWSGGECKRYIDGKCEIFNIRPMICRLFWKVEGDPLCHGGLKPNRYLTMEEFRRIEWCWAKGTIQDAQALRAWMRRTL